jgi:hypothetical protein
MRILLLATACLGLAACSKASDSASDSAITEAQSRPAERTSPSLDVASVANPPGAVAPGGIAVTAAPGVAFAYHYAFRLPSGRIAGVQEAHAQACEKLGIARCRITGMRYRLLGENNVEAMLAFKLDPAIARAFGKNGIGIAETAQGTLVDAEITGTDAGAAIGRLNTQRTRAEDELKRIDAELAKPKLPEGERAELQRQRAEIVQNISATRDSTAEQREGLADTPMVFDYGSGKAVRGFDASAPLTSAADTAIGSVQVTVAVLLGLLALLGPPGIVVLLGWLAWRRFRPRRRASVAAAEGKAVID